MRQFHLVRDVDVTGISGTGVVAEGVEFTDGWVAMHWTTSLMSWCFYRSAAELEEIHGHNGSTRLEWFE